MASSRPHLARRGLAFWSLVAGVVVGAAFLGELAVVEHDFQPEGGLFGLPRWVVVRGDRLVVDRARL